jgi:hypothetical protein
MLTLHQKLTSVVEAFERGETTFSELNALKINLTKNSATAFEFTNGKMVTTQFGKSDSSIAASRTIELSYSAIKKIVDDLKANSNTRRSERNRKRN